MSTDLFSTVKKDSIVRQTFSGEPLDIRDFELDQFVIDDRYRVRTFRFPVEDHLEAVKQATESVMKPISHRGFSDGFFTAVYEAMLNAHQHGNKLDPDKQVTVATKIKPDKVKVAVVDQGGIVVPEFVPFVLHYREQNSAHQGFYEFTDRPKPTERNRGTGTHFMHMYSDGVEYCKTPQGLAVILSKYK